MNESTSWLVAKMSTDLVRLPSLRIDWDDSEFRIFPCVDLFLCLLVVVLLFVLFA